MDRKKSQIFTNIKKALDCSKAWVTQDKPFELSHKTCKTPSLPPIEKRVIYNIFEKENSILPPDIAVKYITSIDDATSAFKEIAVAKGALSLDIETYPKEGGHGLDPFTSKIRLVQLYFGGKSVYVFDLHSVSLKAFPDHIWKRPIICHNALFELKHLLHRGIELAQVGCTMLMGFVLQGYSRGGNISLKGLAKKHLGIDLSKEEQLSDWSQQSLTKEQIDYAAADAVVTHRLFLKLRQEICRRDLLDAYILRRESQKALVKIMLNGVFFNAEAHNKLIESWKEKESYHNKNILKILGEVNLNSSKQLNLWISNNVDPKILDTWPKTSAGSLSVTSKIVSRFKDSIPWYEDYLQYKKYFKKGSTYGKKMQRHIHPFTGRIHPDFLLAGTDTGRLASRNPNIQNFPRDSEFRELFEAPEGSVLVVADYSQIELRVAAIVSKDKAMIQAYEKGEDLHRKTAAVLLDIPESQITKEQRQLAKAVNFGFLFGQGAEGFVNYAKDTYNVDVSLEEAIKAKDKFLETYPDLKCWQRQTRSEARRSLKVKTPSGFIRKFTEAKHTYNQSLNTPIQGGAAEVMLQALTLVDKTLDQSKAKIVNCIHDEIILESFEEYKDEASRILKDSMIAAFSALFPMQTTKSLIEVKTAKNWRNAK